MAKRRFFLLRALSLLALAGCESIPAPGDVVNAQVIDSPRERASLGRGFTDLHAALQAGVTRADAERGRLVRAECGDPDPAARDGVRWRVLTTVLPEGVPATPGSFVTVDRVIEAPAGSGRHHGHYVGAASPPTAAQALRSPSGDRLHTPCRPPGATEGIWRVQLRGVVSAWEIDFAVPERARHQRFGDDELRDGRVVALACQLKVADGSDWNRPVWLARVPEGQRLQVGDVVRLRTGAAEYSKDVDPLAQVIGPAGGVTRPAGPGVVRCH